MVSVSAALVVPCYWQSRIQASDLSSHVYNAWLLEEIKAGRAEGLTVKYQWTNVLFDVVLSTLREAVGLEWAQRISVSGVVLIFAWGAFALIYAVADRRAWLMMPCIAILAYGWVFHMGFFNFYLSTGLSLWALALLGRTKRIHTAGAFVLLLLAAVAHVLPVCWAVGIGAYALVAHKIAGRGRLLLCAVVVGGLITLRFLVTVIFETRWSWTQALLISGADQVWLYSGKYLLVSVGLLLLWWIGFAALLDARGVRQTLTSIPLQSFVLTAMVILLMPTGIHLPPYEHALVLVAPRMSLLAAVPLCACLATGVPRRWLAGGSALLAGIFFSFLYADSSALNRLENRMESLLASLPPGQRVVSALCLPVSRVNALAHVIDRACIGKCFSYANYEPSTGAFRVYARSPNKLVVSEYKDSYALQTGTYMVQGRDVPLYQVYFCDDRNPDLCIRQLKPGDVNALTCVEVTPVWWKD